MFRAGNTWAAQSEVASLWPSTATQLVGPPLRGRRASLAIRVGGCRPAAQGRHWKRIVERREVGACKTSPTAVPRLTALTADCAHAGWVFLRQAAAPPADSSSEPPLR